MAARRKYSPETKAAALASLLEGQAVSRVATDLDVPVGTVKAWSAAARYLASGPETAVVSVATQKKQEIGGLLLEYLHTNLETLRHQSVVFRDPRWLASQSAEGLAVLHGVLADKSIRLLEAMSAATGPI